MNNSFNGIKGKSGNVLKSFNTCFDNFFVVCLFLVSLLII